MKKKKLLSVLLFSSIFALASCTNNSSTSSNDVPLSTPIDTPNSSTITDVPSSSTSEPDAPEFDTITISEARTLPAKSEVTIEGEVIKVLYAQGGSRIAYVYIYDGTAGLALYPSKENPLSTDINEGNHIIASGLTDLYQGMPELTEPEILANDNDEELNIDESWIKDSTISEVNELESEDSLNIYRVPCIATNDPQYNVYRLNDIQSDIYLQAYSQNQYVEYEFLDANLDKPMYVVFMFSLQKNTKHYALPLYYEGEYQISYEDEIKKVLPEITNDLTTVYYENTSFILPKQSVGNKNVSFTYSSSDSRVVITDQGDYYLVDMGADKDFTITATGHYGDNTSKVDINFEIRQKSQVENLTKIDELRDKNDGDQISFEGDIIGYSFDAPTGKRYNSYYVGDETGSIRVTLTADEADKMLLKNGEHVILSGEVDIYADAGNTLTIDNVEVLYHDSKDNGLPFEPITKTFEEMNNFAVDSNDNRAGDVFYMTFKLFKKKNTYGSDTLYYAVALDGTEEDVGGHDKSKVFYSSGGSDLSYLDEYVGHTVKALIGTRDVKAGQSYYRYDCLNGHIEIAE